jgi:hypothetical protein
MTYLLFIYCEIIVIGNFYTIYLLSNFVIANLIQCFFTAFIITYLLFKFIPLKFADSEHLKTDEFVTHIMKKWPKAEWFVFHVRI